MPELTGLRAVVRELVPGSAPRVVSTFRRSRPGEKRFFHSGLTPDGRYFWAVDSGHGRDDVQIVSVRSGAVVQTLRLPGAYGAVAFAHDGKTAYVSGEPKGDSQPAGRAPDTFSNRSRHLRMVARSSSGVM